MNIYEKTVKMHSAFFVFILTLIGRSFRLPRQKLIIGSYFTNYSKTITHQAEIFVDIFGFWSYRCCAQGFPNCWMSSLLRWKWNIFKPGARAQNFSYTWATPIGQCLTPKSTKFKNWPIINKRAKKQAGGRRKKAGDNLHEAALNKTSTQPAVWEAPHCKCSEIEFVAHVY